MAQKTTIPSPTATPSLIPAKSRTLNNLNPRRFSTILRTPPLFFFAKSMSAMSLASPIRAHPPQKYSYPDPNPDFAVTETQKFREELIKKLSKDKETFGNELDAVVNVCTEIYCEFLHTEHGGPGTLLVEPFTDMKVALKEKKLPGAPLAARASLLWAQNFLDQD